MKKALRRKGIVSLLVLFSLSISLTAGEAFAVTQSEIDDIQRQRESLTAQREQSQAKVDELQAEQASVLEQKAALDARSQYAYTRPQSPLCGLIPDSQKSVFFMLYQWILPVKGFPLRGSWQPQAD